MELSAKLEFWWGIMMMMMMSRACTLRRHTGLVSRQTASMNRSGVFDGDANNTGTALSAARKRLEGSEAAVRWRMGRAVRPSKSRGRGPRVDGDLDKSNWPRPDDVGAAHVDPVCCLVHIAMRHCCFTRRFHRQLV
jgi:hypothetical protein